MKVVLDCLPCLIRQALEAARLATDDPGIHQKLVREALLMAADLQFDECPPLLSQRIHARLRVLTGVEDAYRDLKRRFNELALKMLPPLRDVVEASGDPLLMAVRYAIAGNLIDFGVNGKLTEEEVFHAVGRVLDEPFSGGIEEFRTAVAQASDILYLADNAGEIVFDQLLIRELGAGRATVAVRGAPVINDATIEDAEATGLSRMVEVIDNGAGAPGTVLSDCSESFVSRFNRADLIVSKGQGNYETLSAVRAPVFFLLKVKCGVAASHTGLAEGTHALIAPDQFSASGGQAWGRDTVVAQRATQKGTDNGNPADKRTAGAVHNVPRAFLPWTRHRIPGRGNGHGEARDWPERGRGVHRDCRE